MGGRMGGKGRVRGAQATPVLHECFWAAQLDPPEDGMEYEAAPALEDLSTWELELMLNYLRTYLEMVGGQALCLLLLPHPTPAPGRPGWRCMYARRSCSNACHHHRYWQTRLMWVCGRVVLAHAASRR